jgi:hypothetical protein
MRHLSIPKETILGRQLGNMEPENLDERFYAVDALRFLVGGFKRDPSAWRVNRFRGEIKATQKKDSRDKLDSLSRAAWEEHDKIKEEREIEDEYERTGGLW